MGGRGFKSHRGLRQAKPRRGGGLRCGCVSTALVCACTTLMCSYQGACINVIQMRHHKTRYVLAPLAEWFKCLCWHAITTNARCLPATSARLKSRCSCSSAGDKKEQEKLAHIVLVFAVAADFSATLLNISMAQRPMRDALNCPCGGAHFARQNHPNHVCVGGGGGVGSESGIDHAKASIYVAKTFTHVQLRA